MVTRWTCVSLLVRVAMAQSVNQLDMVGAGASSSWASEPQPPGHNAMFWRWCCWRGQTGGATGAGGTGNGARVLAVPVASGAVAPTALLARLGCMSVAAGGATEGR